MFSLPGFTFGLFRQKNQQEELVSSRSGTVTSCGLRHGDMLYMVPLNGTKLWDQPSTSSTSNSIGDCSYHFTPKSDA